MYDITISGGAGVRVMPGPMGGVWGGLAPPRKILPFAVAGGVILMQSYLHIKFFFFNY